MTSAEGLFLRACAAGSPHAWRGTEGDLRSLAPGDWKAVRDHAIEHGFVGLVARGLAWAQEETGFRAPILDELAARRREELVQHLARKGAARRVAEAFTARAVPFVLFKGIVLAEEIYEDLSLRSFRDLDLMVPLERLEEAFAVSQQLGYQLTHLTDVREYVRAGAHAAPLAHPDGTSIDLHWSIAPDLVSPRQIATLWRHTRPAPPGTALPGLRLSPAMTLVHLAKHFHSHQYGELKPLVDFHVASRKLAAQLQPGELAGAAGELDLLPVVEVADTLCGRAFGAAPALSGRHPSGATPRLARRILTDHFLVRSSTLSRIGNWMRYLVTSGSARATARSVGEILVPDRLLLTRFFNRPFNALMYPAYYWRQLLKVLTLSAK